MNPQLEVLRKDYSTEVMKQFVKENQKGDIAIMNMNLKELVKPTYGVEIKINNGDINKGPEYSQKKNDGKMSKKEYRDKYQRVEIQHRGIQ